MNNTIRAFLALAAAGGIASAPAAAQVQPAGEWQYRDEAESCRAFRTFGNGQLVQLRSYGPGSTVEATVMSPQLPNDPGTVHVVELGWDSGPAEENQLGLVGSVGRTPTVTVLTAHRPVASFLFYDQGSVVFTPLDPAAQSLRLRVVGTDPIELQVGSLSEPLSRLMECEVRLMEKWGWGPDYSVRVTRAPEFIDPQLMFYKVIVYPAVQHLNHVSSILQLRLKIDASGRVAECVAQSSPGSDQFGSKNCENFRRFARFRPATDAQGQPVASHVQMSVTFATYD